MDETKFEEVLEKFNKFEKKIFYNQYRQKYVKIYQPALNICKFEENVFNMHNLPTIDEAQLKGVVLNLAFVEPDITHKELESLANKMVNDLCSFLEENKLGGANLSFERPGQGTYSRLINSNGLVELRLSCHYFENTIEDSIEVF